MDPEVKYSDISLHAPQFQTQSVSPVLYYASHDSQIIVIDNVFTPDECNDLIRECANCVVQCTLTSTALRNKKCIQITQLTDALNVRIRRFIPDVLMDWTYDTINEHWRYVHCNPTSTFAPHLDGVFVKSVDLKSIYTVMVYLTESIDHSGQLSFLYGPNNGQAFKPVRGRVVLFNQDLVHEGLANTHDKIFIRSECMYKRTVPVESELDRQAMVLFNKAKNEHNSEQSKQLESGAFALSPLLKNMVYNC